MEILLWCTFARTGRNACTLSLLSVGPGRIDPESWDCMSPTAHTNTHVLGRRLTVLLRLVACKTCSGASLPPVQAEMPVLCPSFQSGQAESNCRFTHPMGVDYHYPMARGDYALLGVVGIIADIRYVRQPRGGIASCRYSLPTHR